MAAKKLNFTFDDLVDQDIPTGSKWAAYRMAMSALYKVSEGCAGCSRYKQDRVFSMMRENNWTIEDVAQHLEYHHREPKGKEGLVTKMIRNTLWVRAMEEVAKCDVYCKKCHIELHTEMKVAAKALKAAKKALKA